MESDLRIGRGTESGIKGGFLALKNIGRGNYFSSDYGTFIGITEHAAPSGDEITRIDLHVVRFKMPNGGATRIDHLGVTSEDRIDYSGSLELIDGKSQSVLPASPAEMLAMVEQVMREKRK